jgi:hypothetical protein
VERSNRFLRLRALSLRRVPAPRAPPSCGAAAAASWPATSRTDSSLRATATSSYVSNSDCAKSHELSRARAASDAAAAAMASSLNRDGRRGAAPARPRAPAPATSSSAPVPEARNDGRGLPDCAYRRRPRARASATLQRPSCRARGGGRAVNGELEAGADWVWVGGGGYRFGG